MVDQFVNWVLTNDIEILSSVAGVAISLIGFTLTIFATFRSKSAAKRAETAAKEALESVRYFDTIEHLSKAIAIIEEIQRLNRAKEWKVLLDRHTTFRNIMTEIKSANISLNEDQQSKIQAARFHSSTIAHKINLALDKDKEPSVARMNKILAEQTEKLGTVLAEIRFKTDR